MRKISKGKYVITYDRGDAIAFGGEGQGYKKRQWFLKVPYYDGLCGCNSLSDALDVIEMGD
jgi:hypothetical protein